MQRGKRSSPATGGAGEQRAERERGGQKPSAGERRRVMLLHFDYFNIATYRGVVDWVREHDWALDASCVQSRQLPRIAKVDGILTTINMGGTADWLRKFGCPIVRMHAVATPELLAGCRELPAVECDFVSAGRLGAEHLLTLGKPHFVFYQRGHGEDSHALMESFVATIRAAGHEPTVLDFLADNPLRSSLHVTALQERLSWLGEKMKRLPRPMAIMTEDDRYAPDVVEAARSLGLRVPVDVAVLGCDDNSFAHGVSAIPISSVDSNTRGVGYAAADLLARLSSGEAPPSSTVLVPATRVIGRQSTATYAGGHPGLNAVLQTMRQRFRQRLEIADLAKSAKLSVRGLQHAFKKELGQTFYEELTRLRVGAAIQLLEETDLKLDAVAAETNLGDAKNLCRIFAKVHGTSPDLWRRKHRNKA